MMGMNCLAGNSRKNITGTSRSVIGNLILHGALIRRNLMMHRRAGRVRLGLSSTRNGRCQQCVAR